MNNQETLKINDSIIKSLVVERFLKYTRYCTTSNRRANTTPTSAGQWELAKVLLEELQNLGVKNAVLTEHCYVIAKLPATSGKENTPTIGFIAHLDTAEHIPGKDVKAQLIEKYDGKKIELADGNVLDPDIDQDLADEKGKSIIHTDGNTLLGADDKAGIAEIMGAIEYILKHPEIEHGEVEIIFTPDEETGKGLPELPRELIKSTACYTLDGSRGGELEIECFNAYYVDIKFKGKAMHLGYARGIMINALLMAAHFAAMLPRAESPEATDGYYGYYCPMSRKPNNGTFRSLYP